MSTYSVPPGCTGIELPNGQKIDANRQGKVVIDDRRAEKFASKSTVSGMGVLSKTALGFGHIKENTAICEDCNFRGWGWQTTCPKCSGKMIYQTEETQ